MLRRSRWNERSQPGPTSRQWGQLWPLFTFVAMVFVGCMPGKIKALEAYSQVCKRDLKPKLTRYATLFQQASRAKSRQALHKELRDKILPALNIYVTALQQVRPKPQKLRQIHGALTHAYTHWYESVRRFSKGLTSDAAWVRVAAGLQHGATQVAKAEQQHHEQLKQYARPPKRRR